MTLSHTKFQQIQRMRVQIDLSKSVNICWVEHIPSWEFDPTQINPLAKTLFSVQMKLLPRLIKMDSTFSFTQINSASRFKTKWEILLAGNHRPTLGDPSQMGHKDDHCSAKIEIRAFAPAYKKSTSAQNDQSSIEPPRDETSIHLQKMVNPNSSPLRG